jgi:ATP-dependent Lon protease
MTTAVVKQELAVASFSKVYSLDDVETALNDLSEGASDALRATYEKMLKVGNLRFCVKPNRMPCIDDLAASLPNFAEPLDDIRKQIALCLETDDLLELIYRQHSDQKVGTSHA